MFLIIAIILVVLWLLGITVFKMTRGIIHLVLLIAVVLVVLHFVRGM